MRQKLIIKSMNSGVRGGGGVRWAKCYILRLIKLRTTVNECECLYTDVEVYICIYCLETICTLSWNNT